MDISMKISVIVPVYNVEHYLDRCIQSIVSQTYTNLEIILVDDGSEDHCPATCDDWTIRDERIKTIHKENGGLSDARNIGMLAATGEYIAFVDSDDWIAPRMLELLFNAMQEDKSDIAACAVEMVWEDDTPSCLLTVKTKALLSREEAQRALLNETLLKHPVWYKLYKRELICDILFKVGKYHEDIFWSYQAIGKANSVSLIDIVGYYYTQRANSIMGQGYSLKRLDALEAIEERYAYIKSEFPALECEARLSILSNCIYHGQMALRFLNRNEIKLVFDRLNLIKSNYKIVHKDYSDKKITHRLWFDIARVSLPAVCRLKNMLGIGM